MVFLDMLLGDDTDVQKVVSIEVHVAVYAGFDLAYFIICDWKHVRDGLVYFCKLWIQLLKFLCGVRCLVVYFMVFSQLQGFVQHTMADVWGD